VGIGENGRRCSVIIQYMLVRNSDLGGMHQFADIVREELSKIQLQHEMITIKTI